MFHIIIKEMKEFLRDKTNLFFFFLFPISLVFLLGNLLGSMDQADELIGEIRIHYSIETENQYHTIAVESFVNTITDNRNFFFEEVTDLERSKKLAGSDDITAVVVFRGDPLEIHIYEGTNHIKNRTVNAIMNGFAQTNKSLTAVIKNGYLQNIKGPLIEADFIQQKDLGINRTMLDYYAISMLAMISFLSLIIGAGAFLGERKSKTINRLIISPKSRVSIFLQTILGLVPQVILQISVIMLFSVFVFKANYAATIFDNIYLFFMFLIVTIAMISIGAVIGLTIKANPVAVIMPFLWLMMFFGGTYSKEINIKGLTNHMPIYQLQQAAFDLSVFGRYQMSNRIIIICTVILIVMLTIGAAIFRGKEEER